MKGLILKELYFYKANWLMYLIFIAVFFLCVAATGNPFIIAIAYMMSTLMPSSVFAYDEKAKWTQYSCYLPVSRKDAVAVKYLSIIAIYVMFCILTALGVFINAIINGFEDMSGFRLLLPCFAIFIILLGVISLVMPFIFKLGAEKGRYVFMVLGGLCGGFGALFSSTIDEDSGVLNLLINLSGHGALLIACAAAVGVLIFIGSWALSVKFYNKREL